MATRWILMHVYILQLTGVLLVTQGEYNRLVGLPEHPTFCKPGDCSELSWSYQLGQGDEVSKVTFGTWVHSKGYVEQILVRVKPNHVYTRPNYKSKLTWTGNLSGRASVRLCNVTKEDQAYYGVEIDIRGKTSLMTGTELRVTGIPTSNHTAALICEKHKNRTVRLGRNFQLTDTKNIGKNVSDGSDLTIRMLPEGSKDVKIGTCNIFRDKSNSCTCFKEDLKKHTSIDPDACKIQVSNLYQLADDQHVNATIDLGKANKNMSKSFRLEFEVMHNNKTLTTPCTRYEISYEASTTPTIPTTTSGAGRSTNYRGSLLTCWALFLFCRGLLPF